MGDTKRSGVPAFSPGLFSSLNTVRGLNKSPAREGKITHSQERLAYLARPRSANHLASARPGTARQASPRVDDTWSSRTFTLVRPTNEEELQQATATVERLHRQLESQKKGEVSVLKDYQVREEAYQTDIFRLQQDCAALQTALQQAKSKSAATLRENERLQTQLDEAYTSLAESKDALRSLAVNLLDVIEQQMTRPDPDSLRNAVLQRLEETARASQVNLTACFDRVANWGQQPRGSIQTEASTMQQIPFDQIGSSNGEEADTQELEAVKQNVLKRISGYSQSQTTALALYDFPGTAVETI